jgi:dipeptidase E
MRLFLFSDHIIPENGPLDRMLLSVANTASPSVVWIPSGSRPEKSETYFLERKAYYQAIGVRSVSMFNVCGGLTKSRVDELMKCDILHLSGGDPYVFLGNLRKTGMLEVIRERARTGGIIVGDSAGAMLMAADIEITKFDGRPVPAELENLSALRLVDFEFHAHYGRFGASEQALRAYTLRKRSTVYAVPDGSGLAVLDGQIHKHGPITCFENGDIVS